MLRPPTQCGIAPELEGIRRAGNCEHVVGLRRRSAQSRKEDERAEREHEQARATD